MRRDVAPLSLLATVAVALIILLAMVIRFQALDTLSFYGDEETTAFAARSVLDNGYPAMPSGMHYHRAPLYSYMAAASAQTYGVEREFAYRLPAYLFGVMALLLMWFGSWRLLGFGVGALAAVLFATSEWHAVTSGYARMYSPYLALFICAAYCFVDWVRNRRVAVLLLGLAFFALSASFQILSVFALTLLILPYLAMRQFELKQFVADLGIALALLLLSVYLDSVLVQEAYTNFAIAMDGQQRSTVLDNVAIFWLPIVAREFSVWQAFLAIGGLSILVLALGKRMPWRTLPWNLAVWSLVLLTLVMFVLGQVYALALCLYGVLVLLHCAGYPLRAPLMIMLITGLSAIGVSYLIDFESGFERLIDPTRQIVFPYLAALFFKYPLLVSLALLAPFLTNPEDASDSLERKTAVVVTSFALFVVANMLAFGVIGQWFEDRYIVHVYPFLIVLTGYALFGVLQWLWQSLATRGLPLAAAAFVVLVAALAAAMPHHLLQGMLRSAQRDHGFENIENGRYFPDHAAAGRYVAARLQPGDRVVASDVLQQRWYVGQADYWLRSLTDVSRYIYVASDGKVRDIYVHAEHLNENLLASLLDAHPRIWVILSSIDMEEDWAFSAAENAFLERVAARGRLEFRGRDGRSKVYLVESLAGAQARALPAVPAARPASAATPGDRP
ncbi:MAG: glycosyltransferase family 39 protein [Pseudomonadota bacterium]